LIKRRNAHQPMHAGFGRQQTIRIFALDFKSHALDAGFLARLIIDNFGLESSALGPLDVHAQEHLSPILRFRSARPGMNGADRIAGIVFPGQKRLGLRLQDFVLESLEQRPYLSQRRIIFLGKLKEHASVGNFIFKLFVPFDDPLQAAALLQKSLRRVLIGPEVRRRSLGFDAF